MPRNMSFALTTQQVIDRTKDVTRRFGWDHLQVGERVVACEKCMGIKRGEKITRLRTIEVVSIRKERADEITRYPDPAAECAREGFPDTRPEDFVKLLCAASGKSRQDTVNRIEFRYVD